MNKEAEAFLNDIRKSKEGVDYGYVGNGILYDMCKKYPRHNNESEIIAKIWIIGRSYAASIERNRNRDENIF